MEAPKIVFGLGNPGARYEATRHNVGFRVLDRLAEHHGARFRLPWSTGRSIWTAKVDSSAGPLILAKPRTYMNRSGKAARLLCDRRTLSPESILAVYDDADLELGRLRLRPGGGTGGHNGIRSMIEALGTDRFPRVRLGVRGAGRAGAELADYVLEPFEPDEEPIAGALVALAADAVLAILEGGLVPAMNVYNARFAKPVDPEQRSEEEG